jgi:hypothetical protein
MLSTGREIARDLRIEVLPKGALLPGKRLTHGFERA